MSEAKKWLKVGEILRGKDNAETGKKGELYVKFKTDFAASAGTTLQIKEPRKSLDEAVTAGRLTEEKAAEYKAKIPSFVAYDLILPPARG